MPKFHTICDLNEFLESFPWGRLTCIEDVEFGDVVARFGDDENPNPTQIDMVKFIDQITLAEGHKKDACRSQE